MKRSGFTLIEIMIVVAIIGLLAALSVPNYAKARQNTELNIIYSNLRVLEQAKDQWAIETHQQDGAAVANLSVLGAYLKGATILSVVNETYSPNAVGTPASATLPANVGLNPFPPGAVITGPGQ